jgi:hypothetical protein
MDEVDRYRFVLYGTVRVKRKYLVLIRSVLIRTWPLSFSLLGIIITSLLGIIIFFNKK